MAGPLGTEALASLRTYRQRYLMPDSCVLMARTEGTDTGGGPSVTYPDGATVACRLLEATGSAREQIIGQRPAAREPVEVYLPHGTSLQEDDRLRHVPSGDVIEILSVPEASWSTSQRVLGVVVE